MDDSYISALPQAPTFTVRGGTVREADAAAAALGFTPGLALASTFFEPDPEGVIRLTAGGRPYTLQVRDLGDVRLCSLYAPAEEPAPPVLTLDALSRASGAIRRSLQELNIALERLSDGLDPEDRALLRQSSVAQRSMYQLERTAAHLNLFHLLLTGTYPMHRSRCEVGARLYALCSEAEYLLGLRGKKLTLSLPRESTIAVLDWNLVSLIIWELLGNAAGQPGSEICLEAVCKGKELLTVSVRSALAAPLPEQVLQRWSEPPETLDELQKTGMGLSLAAAAARCHGGRLLLSTDSSGFLTAAVCIRMEQREDTGLGSITLNPITSLDLGLTLLSPELPPEAYDPRGL